MSTDTESGETTRDKRRRRGAKFREDLSDPRHGTTNGFCNLLCRCERCKAAWATYFDGSRRRRSERLEEATHGSASTYTNWRCRCRPCTDAYTADCRKRGKGQSSPPVPAVSSLDTQ